MTPPPIFVKEIMQKDNHTFVIRWTDGKIGEYRLNELQKRCSCANCIDETTGKRLLDESTVKSDVKATKIYNVGRYALRIQFSSGCSTGIYPFEMLHNMCS